MQLVLIRTIQLKLLSYLSFLTGEGNSEASVQQTELLGYLFKLLAPQQVSGFIKQSVYLKYIWQREEEYPAAFC